MYHLCMFIVVVGSTNINLRRYLRLASLHFKKLIKFSQWISRILVLL